MKLQQCNSPKVNVSCDWELLSCSRLKHERCMAERDFGIIDNQLQIIYLHLKQHCWTSGVTGNESYTHYNLRSFGHQELAEMNHIQIIYPRLRQDHHWEPTSIHLLGILTLSWEFSSII